MSEVTIKLDFGKDSIQECFNISPERFAELRELTSRALADGITNDTFDTPADILKAVIAFAKNNQELCMLAFIAGCHEHGVQEMIVMKNKMGL